MPSPASRLFKAASLKPQGIVAWGRPVPVAEPGVYLVSLSDNPDPAEGTLDSIPINSGAIADLVGNDRRRARAAAVSMVAVRRCQDPGTPLLSARHALVTPRELKVASDAADGMTSPEISENRFISVRTVDNHLSSIYRKLDLAGREELATVFEAR